MNEVKVKRVKWDREKLIASASKYKTKVAWQKGDYSAYQAAQRNGWLDDPQITGHMVALRIDWTKPMLIASASKYKTKVAWKNGDSNAYAAATTRGWLEDPQITRHMKAQLIYWTKPMLIASASKYKTKVAWKKGDPKAYDAACSRGLIDDPQITSHMEAQLIYWTKPMLIASAALYVNKSAWQTGDPSAYQTARIRGWLDDPQITGHMKAQLIYWTKPMLIASAALYVNKSAWQTGDPNAYAAACYNGWLDDPQITGHMGGNIKWTKPMLIASAALYDTRGEWDRGDPSAYQTAYKRGWLNDPQITGHMVNGLKSDNDAIYIWKAVDRYHQGLPVYKIGTTSARLDDQRIKEVAKGIGFDFELVMLAKVLEKATDIESALLKLGVNPQYSGFDGATEFRALDDTDLAYALSIITANIDIKHKPKSRAHLTLVA